MDCWTRNILVAIGVALIVFAIVYVMRRTNGDLKDDLLEDRWNLDSVDWVWAGALIGSALAVAFLTSSIETNNKKHRRGQHKTPPEVWVMSSSTFTMPPEDPYSASTHTSDYSQVPSVLRENWPTGSSNFDSSSVPWTSQTTTTPSTSWPQQPVRPAYVPWSPSSSMPSNNVYASSTPGWSPGYSNSSSNFSSNPNYNNFGYQQASDGWSSYTL